MDKINPALLCRLRVAALCATAAHAQIDPDDEDEAREWLVVYNAEAQLQFSAAVDAEWTYNTNITDENLQATVSARVRGSLSCTIFRYTMSHVHLAMSGSAGARTCACVMHV